MNVSNRMMKKGVSPVVATVLLIVLTLVTVSIVAVFVVPFVTNSLHEKDACFKVLDKINFDEGSAYNCYTLGAVNRSSFSVAIDSDDIVGISATLFFEGNADTKKINANTSYPDVRNLNSNFNQIVEIPTRGGVRTYVTNKVYTRVELNGILKNGKTCDNRVTITLPACREASVISRVTQY